MPRIVFAILAGLAVAGVAYVSHPMRLKRAAAAPLPANKIEPEPELPDRVHSEQPNRPLSSKDFFAAIASQDSGAALSVLDRYLPAWMTENPADAAELLSKTNLGSNRELVLGRVAQLWARRDPDQALRWASVIPAAEERETLMSYVCLTWAETNPLHALALANSKLTNSRPNTVASVIANWASKDMISASDWVLSQPKDHVRNELIQQIAIKQAELQPRQAARLVLQEIPAGETQSEAVISVLHQWALRDPVSAKAWIDVFPSGTTKERALRELTNLSAHR